MALLSRVGLDDVVRGLPDEPRFPTPDAPAEARAVTATCGGLRVTSVYVPNGRTPDDPHYAYKLEWLAALQARGRPTPATAVVAGDMNIAPTDDDLWDPALFVDSTHVTPAERAALAELIGLGLHDVVRDRWPADRIFTYWDYRAGRFHQDKGMRIDLVLAGARPGRPGGRGVGGPQGPQGQRPVRPRPGDRRPGRRRRTATSARSCPRPRRRRSCRTAPDRPEIWHCEAAAPPHHG